MKIFTAQTNYNLPTCDYNLIWAILALLGTGLVMVYSSSIALAAASSALDHQSHYYLLRQAVFMLIGFFAGYICFLIPVYFWQKIAPTLFIIGVILLIIVLIPGVGKEAGGSQRWIPLGIINFQPSELVKLFTVMYVSDYVLRKSKQIRTIIKGFLPILAVIVLTAYLLLQQPDFGASAVIVGTALGILFLGGLTYKIFISLIFLAPPIIYYLITSAAYRLVRLQVFLDPYADRYHSGWQLTNSLQALGRGEIFGSGLGASIAKLHYLPEPHTDHIVAVIGEEFGLFGVTIIIMLFGYLVVRMFGIAKESIQNKKHFSSLIAQGVAIWFAIQGIINIGSAIGFIPPKGITLPFVSYGGTGMLVNMVAIAIILRIDHDNRKNMRGQSYKI